MGLLACGSVRFSADLVIFDKDGTLTDFEFMWGRLTAVWLSLLAEEVGDPGLAADLGQSLGYDLRQRRTLRNGPLVGATEEELEIIVAAVLFRRGMPWAEAQSMAWRTFQSAVRDLPTSQRVRALGDVAGLMERLRAAGVRVGVVTIDGRAHTETILRLLGVADAVDVLVCGDEGLAWKPSTQMFQRACALAGVDPQRVAVVGDTMADMEMAAAGGAGLRVAVLSGVGDAEQLRLHSDVVLCGIDEIRVA
jgi:phosphoglycolate phosphatase